MSDVPSRLKMDVYSTYEVPFDAAAYCRGRKFCPESVALARAIRARDEAREKVLQAEAALDAASAVLTGAVAEVSKKIEGDGR